MTETLDGYGLSETDRKKLFPVDEWKIASSILKYAMENVEVIGESLRDFAFVGEGLGCYLDFELREGFIRIQEETPVGKALIQAIQ
jgi:hypothetical protein